MLGRLVRLPLAWALTVSFAVSSTIAYTAFGWLPTILVDIAGVMPATAGTLLSLFGFVGLPCSLVAPVLITRFRATGVLYGVAVVLGIAGVVGFLVAPAVAPWLWTVLFGMAPLLFPMILVLLSVRSRSHHTAVALSSFVQSIGYAIAAVFPLAIGLLHDATGGWEVPLWVLGAVIVCAVPAGIIVTRSRTVEDAWEARHGPW